MKRLTTIAIGVLNLLMVSAQGYVVEDDIYYTKKTAENPIVAAKKQQQQQQQRIVESASQEVNDVFSSSDYKGSSRSADEYNRRSLGEMSLDELDSLSVVLNERKESGYYLNDFNGTQEDAEYAARIQRFHNPRYTVFIGDPAYNDIYFLNSWDWNVYVDGSYAFVTPTWNNPFYWNYRWAPYSYSNHYWRWGGMHSPWAWNSHWGWDPWRYDPWGYSGYHNFNHYHYNPYWSGYRPSYARSGKNYESGRRSTYQSNNRGNARYYSGGSNSGRGSRYTTVSPSTGSSSSSSSSGGRYYRGSSSTSSSEMRSSGVYRGSTNYESSSSRSPNYNSPTPSSSSSSSSSGNSYRSSSSGGSRSYSGGSGSGGYINSRGSRR